MESTQKNSGKSWLHHEQINNILDSLRDDNVKRVVLVGEPGAGKTWIARNVSDSAVEADLFNLSLWVYLNRNYDRQALCKSIAGQLIFAPTDCEMVQDDCDDDQDEDSHNWEKLKIMIHEALEKKKFLLVLDDEGYSMTEGGIKPMLEYLLPLDHQDAYKVLITTSNQNSDSGLEEKRISVNPLSNDKSLLLLKERIPVPVYEMPQIQGLAKDFLNKSRRSPIEVIMIAKALTYFGENDYGLGILYSALSEDTKNLNAMLLMLLCSEYDLFPLDILVDCARDSSTFFHDRGSFHYRELITYWILESFIGHVDSLEKTYERGYHILLELIDCGILKTVEANHLIVNSKFCKSLLDLYEFKFFVDNAVATLGMGTLSRRKWEGLGRIMLIDGRSEGFLTGQNLPKSISTVMFDGNCFGMEFLDKFLQLVPDIEALALFNPCFSSLPSSLTKMGRLKLLVLRGCDFLQSISHFLDIKYLTALEISRPSSLESIPDEFFGHVRFLQSLTLSSLQIVKLPSSLSYLTELVRVVIHQCSQLEILPSFRNARKLKVLDFSGSTSLIRCTDRSFNSNLELQTLNLSHSMIKSVPILSRLKNLTSLHLRDCRSIDRLPKISHINGLQVLDLSGSSIKEFQDSSFEACNLKIINLSHSTIASLPRNIGNVHGLYLRGCRRLQKLCSFESLTDLEELDLSYSSHLSSIEDNFFTCLTALKILNLSGTNLKSLPSISSLLNLRKLLLSHCLSLEKLGEISCLTKLEVLDLSGCSSLTEIQCKSFNEMSALQCLFLSDTKISCLPSFPNHSNLRRLVLEKCVNLNVVPLLESLKKLEELNLSGISSVGDTGADFLSGMSNLRILNLTESGLQRLPSLSNLRNLKYLSLRFCSNLRDVPGLAALEKLEHVDLSGTAVEDLPSFTGFSNLRHLMLKDCFNLKAFQHLELLTILRDGVKELPYGISRLTRLQQLELPNMKIEGFHSENAEQPQGELNRPHWFISSWPAKAPVDSNNIGISVSSSSFLPISDQDPSLWQTSFVAFHFLVHPLEAQNRCIEMIFYRQELLIRDMNFHRLQNSHSRKQKRSLGIFGFYDIPRSIEPVLCCADFVFLIKNSFMKWLCDLGEEKIKEIKACWIERCNYMEGVFLDDDEEHAAESVEDVKGKGKLDDEKATGKTGYGLEVLWVSDVVRLKRIYWGNLKGNSFRNLKIMHLEYCPQLSSICPSPFVLENLEVLRIKFCDRFVNLCESGSPELPRLRELQLWELPELKNIGCIASSLDTLLIGGCHLLLNIFSSTFNPENLQVFEVKSCDNLEALFEDDGGPKVVQWHTLRLWDLPKLKGIGAELPALLEIDVRGCFELPSFFLSFRSWNNEQ